MALYQIIFMRQRQRDYRGNTLIFFIIIQKRVELFTEIWKGEREL